MQTVFLILQFSNRKAKHSKVLFSKVNITLFEELRLE